MVMRVEDRVNISIRSVVSNIYIYSRLRGGGGYSLYLQPLHSSIRPFKLVW